MKGADQLVELVRAIEDALAIVRYRTEKRLGISLQKAELELRFAAKKTAGVGGSIEIIVPIEAGVERAWSNLQTFTLSLTPAGGSLDLGEPPANELADAILALAATIDQLARVKPASFTLGTAGLSIGVELTTEGKLQVVFGGGGKSSTAHTINLTFRRNGS